MNRISALVRFLSVGYSLGNSYSIGLSPAPTRHRKNERKTFTAKAQSTHTRTTSGTIPIFSVSSVSLW
jgi:hypothetical protein